MPYCNEYIIISSTIHVNIYFLNTESDINRKLLWKIYSNFNQNFMYKSGPGEIFFTCGNIESLDR